MSEDVLKPVEIESLGDAVDYLSEIAELLGKVREYAKRHDLVSQSGVGEAGVAMIMREIGQADSSVDWATIILCDLYDALRNAEEDAS